MTSTTSSPKSLLLVKAADSADFGEGRNQPETLRFCDPSDPWTPWTSSFPAVAAVRLSSLTPYHLVMTNSLPWEDPPFLRTVNHLFLWAIYTMAMSVITRWYNWGGTILYVGISPQKKDPRWRASHGALCGGAGP